MKILEGIRVLDLTRLYPGPFCTKMLADMGAEVIKVESPEEGDYSRKMGPRLGEDSYFYQLLNRNKKSISLNLKDPEGVALFLRLTKGADVVVEGFRPGVMDTLGIGYETVRRSNPEIVYCSISGYGQDGPYRLRAGHDINYIGIAGILYMTGEQTGPPVIPSTQIGDVGGGSLMALAAILAALLGRSRGKGGRYLDVSMLDGLISWLPLMTAELFADNPLERGNTTLNGKNACYNVYQTSDGKYMSLGALEAKFWVAFCQAVGRTDLIEKQYQRDQALLKKEIQGIFRSRSRGEWEELFMNYDACCEPVLSLHEMQTHSQVVARGMISDQALGFPVKISNEEKVLENPAPSLGANTREILFSEGFSKEEIEKLEQRKVV